MTSGSGPPHFPALSLPNSAFLPVCLLLQEIRQLQQKQAGLVREVSDLQETIEWKDRKLGVGSGAPCRCSMLLHARGVRGSGGTLTSVTNRPLSLFPHCLGRGAEDSEEGQAGPAGGVHGPDPATLQMMEVVGAGS